MSDDDVFTLQRADIEVVLDLLDKLAELTEDLSPEDAVMWRGIVGQVKAKAGDVFSLIDTRLLQLADGQPVVVGDKVFVKDIQQVYRPNQSRISGLVIRHACVAPDGTTRKTREAVEIAVGLMKMLYVADATEPKVGGLKALSVTKADVGDFFDKDPKIKESK